MLCNLSLIRRWGDVHIKGAVGVGGEPEGEHALHVCVLGIVAISLVATDGADG